jgi:hypothetical protein
MVQAFSADDLKRQVYSPIGHGQAEQELLHIRKTLVKVLTDDGLKVRVVTDQGEQQKS